jgi:hypothetical protein
MAGFGGRQPGAGRPKGVPNKVSAPIRELAQAFGPEIIEKLGAIAGLQGACGSEVEATRILAMRELLDRGYGKATQVLAGDADNPLGYVIRGPSVVNSVEEWLKLRPQRVIDAEPQ